MLISDWSSDVCSSDLGLVETLLELEPAVRLFVIGKRGVHANFVDGQLGSKLESVVRAASRPVLIASRAFRAIKRFMIAFDGSATTRRCRSEEHTSELQSLMRNPLSRLRLKKKKNNNYS